MLPRNRSRSGQWAICNREVTLAQAQEAIASDWSSALASLGLT